MQIGIAIDNHAALAAFQANRFSGFYIKY